jgi:hypothetical protein
MGIEYGSRVAVCRTWNWCVTLINFVLRQTSIILDKTANVDDVLNRSSALLKAKYDVFEYKIDTERDKFPPPSSSRRLF